MYLKRDSTAAIFDNQGVCVIWALIGVPYCNCIRSNHSDNFRPISRASATSGEFQYKYNWSSDTWCTCGHNCEIEHAVNVIIRISSTLF